MKITGTTKIYGIFGCPVTHTASPAMHNAAFAKLGLDCAYCPFEVAPEKIAHAAEGIRAMKLQGVNITVPHKEKILKSLDELSPEAAVIGAVNTIVNKNGKLIGYNTDGVGFLRSLEKDGRVQIKGKKMVLFGAGGAGRAVAIQSLLVGLKDVVIVDVIDKKARDLAKHINSKIRGLRARTIPAVTDIINEVIPFADIIVHATPIGMKPADPLPFDTSCLHKGQIVYDLIYNPPQTKLLRTARKKGCRTFNGLGMLLHQGCKAFEIWTGVAAPVAVMDKALKRQVYK
jgi:shikimate dehydrogenase